MTQPTWIGHSLKGRYLIEGELGHGGMSSVYKATDSNLRRVVAVKLIHSHMSGDPQFVRRFEAEATVVAKLRHPNIVQVYDFDHEAETYYIIFEYVPGETLQERLRRLNESNRKMDLDEVLKTATSIAEALQYAHERDIVHRDVKPANVMLNVQGDAILTDFGIVKIVGGTQHTATGTVIGTARYMSPEQIKGQRIDSRTDIYSFGVMLYEMAGGRPPFDSDSAMTLMMMHVSEPVPDVRSIRTEVPAGLVRVINRALAKEPEKRYQTMDQVLADLRQVQEVGRPGVSPAGEARPQETMLEQDLTDLIEADESYSQPAYTRPPTARQGGAAPPRVRAAQDKSQRNIIIAGVALAAVAVVAVFLIFSFLGNGDKQGGAQAGDGGGDTGGETGDAEAIAANETATPTRAAATDEPTATATPSPTNTPPPTATSPPPPTATSPPPLTATSPPPPTATSPPALPYTVRISGISLNGDRYVVNYETTGYTETLPGMHVHFFFNTVPPEQAGNPGSGPWILYGGPRPFTGYGTGDRGAATQMCALVANPDHSVIAGSGNCVNLP